MLSSGDWRAKYDVYILNEHCIHTIFAWNVDQIYSIEFGVVRMAMSLDSTQIGCGTHSQ